MSFNDKPTTRRTILVGAAALTGLPILAATTANAAGTVAQTAAHYVPDHTKAPASAGHQCSGCNYFLAGPKPGAVGQCKLVAGAINPNGWCQLYAAKHA